jgi:uncharacterized protein with PIN domain
MINRVKETTGRCPNCDNKVVQKSGSETKLRVAHPIYFDEEGRCLAKCHWCKTQIEVPVELEKSVEVENERFTIRSDT